MERFAAAAGIKLIHVPYPGLAPAMRDLLAGHIDAIFDTPGNTMPHLASGGVKALATSVMVVLRAVASSRPASGSRCRCMANQATVSST